MGSRERRQEPARKQAQARLKARAGADWGGVMAQPDPSLERGEIGCASEPSPCRFAAFPLPTGEGVRFPLAAPAAR